MYRKTLFRLLASLAILAILPGCGLIDEFYLPTAQDTAQELYEAGQFAMQERNYGDAAEFFTKLKDRYPFSPYALQAELALGDAYFLDRDYDEAVTAYKEFESLHPRSEHMPYVLYQIGVASTKRFNSIDRPQDNIIEALDYFYRLRQEYPGTEYAKNAPTYIKKCRRYLAEHELYVADFYWQDKQYGPAWKRYSYVVENFQDLPEMSAYADRMAEIAYFEYQKNKSETKRVKQHGSWKEWFDWL
ncbi:outer membrane protein assembly factor BamD [Desulfohalovibrio reitneri]|uniref:outer membrane protein assembly factor BamD n=1 Tax=Desulfohalovibrio reitneri TaxID=1307759 RepID=UPI0004A6FBD1|nr:outer membrane protein assembly factor BamD [Desulfohalovibrio reitneri]